MNYTFCNTTKEDDLKTVTMYKYHLCSLGKSLSDKIPKPKNIYFYQHQ